MTERRLSERRQLKRVALASGALLVVLLVVAQVVLPRIAERKVKAELEKIGVATDVSVSAFPAVKLLFGEIDSLGANLANSEASDGEVADLIAKADKIDRLRVNAGRIRVSGLELTDARLTKDGDRIRAEASLALRDLVAFLPPGTELRSVSSRDGQLLLDGSFTVLGVSLSGPATVSPQGGAIVASPQGAAFGGLAQLTIFSDERVMVERLDAAEETGGGLRLSAAGRVAGG